MLYLILHGIVAGKNQGSSPDVDFFLGRNYLVTVRHEPSPSIETERAICSAPDVLAEGRSACCTASSMPSWTTTGPGGRARRLDGIEDGLQRGQAQPVADILAQGRHRLPAPRRPPQRDAIGRLARREFPQISEALSYRFRDVYDHLVRLADEATFLQDRVSGLIDAHLATQSNRLNQVMKVLTVISTIFMPLTVLTGVFGMNVKLLEFPGGPGAQFWWIAAIMALICAGMLWMFRRLDWL
jgi:magnesium transporter